MIQHIFHHVKETNDNPINKHKGSYKRRGKKSKAKMTSLNRSIVLRTTTRNGAMMRFKSSSLLLLLSFLAVGFHFASSSNISYGAIEPHRYAGRSLLQKKTSCNVDFENMNYSVITSQCKGPRYKAELCCTALKQLLCPVKDKVNNLGSTCAATFFSYASLYGRYPSGLFSSLCKEQQEGLDCTGFVNTSKKTAGSLPAVAPSSPLFLLFVGFSLLLFHV